MLQRLGLPDERIVEVPWHELDRAVEPDHLTSVYVPALAAPVAGEVAAFAELVRRLRADCPWDREQTHQSLRRHLIEEAYEVLEAIDHLDVEAGEGYDDLEEELGDLLFQVVFHATLAAEEGRFTLADVARGIATQARRPPPARVRRRHRRERRARWPSRLGAAQEGREGPGQRDGRHPGRPAGAAVRVQGAEEGGVAGRRLAATSSATPARSPDRAGSCSTWSTTSASPARTPRPSCGWPPSTSVTASGPGKHTDAGMNPVLANHCK